MVLLVVTVRPEDGTDTSTITKPTPVEVSYTRAFERSRDNPELPTSVSATARAFLNHSLLAQVIIDDVEPKSSIELRILSDRGVPRVVKRGRLETPDGPESFNVVLNAVDISAIQRPEPRPVPNAPSFERNGLFVPTSQEPVVFQHYRLAIGPLNLGNGDWTRLGLQDVFKRD